jgi:hypothetical protein
MVEGHAATVYVEYDALVMAVRFAVTCDVEFVILCQKIFCFLTSIFSLASSCECLSDTRSGSLMGMFVIIDRLGPDRHLCFFSAARARLGHFQSRPIVSRAMDQPISNPEPSLQQLIAESRPVNAPVMCAFSIPKALAESGLDQSRIG